MIQITMNPYDSSLTDIKQLSKRNWQAFKLQYTTKQEKYQWIVTLLNQWSYRKLKKKQKCFIIEFLASATSHDRKYIRLLIHRYLSNKLVSKEYTRKKPHRTYGIKEIKLLAETDIIHRRLSAPATKKIFLREYNVFHHQDFEILSKISTSHINNLRHSTGYDCHYKIGTKPHIVPIGETRKPEPNGKPGSIRIDTVHQRDVFYLNVVDEVVQWEFIFCVPKISEFFLVPIFESMLELFPFKIFNFHSDRGPEFINHIVAEILQRLLIHQTKSRSRHCNDNALVEMKNGYVIRKHMGYGFIEDVMAPTINNFLVKHFNEYLNYHRPCGFRTGTKKSLVSKRTYYQYGEYKTPYEKLKSLENASSYLKEGITFETLDKIAMRMSDNQYAKMLTEKRTDLFSKINNGRHGQFSIPDFHH